MLLDAGFVVTLSPVVKRSFAEFFLNMARGRGIECADVVLRSAEHVPPTADVGWFRDPQRRSGIAAAPEFVFPLVSLLVVEGMINEFDVDVDFQAEAVPTLLSALAS